jgi:hypothetical protein
MPALPVSEFGGPVERLHLVLAVVYFPHLARIQRAPDMDHPNWLLDWKRL